MRIPRLAIFLLLLSAPPALGQVGANLLRNADFQDDWATLLPQSKTLHWSYPYDYQNRRDYNPDGWAAKGTWEWVDGDAAPGERRLVLRGPSAEVVQRVNWIAIHDDRTLDGFPDAGGFPTLVVARSHEPLRLVRDLVFRVRVRGSDVPAGAAAITIALCPPGKPSAEHALGTMSEATVTAESALPTGKFDWQWVEVALSAEAWKRAAEAAAASDPGAAAEGLALPSEARVAVRYGGPSGEIEIGRAELFAADSPAANLVANGGFEESGSDRVPVGWGPPQKYGYVPPGHYYRFNTWHNEGFQNRGKPVIDSLIVHGGRSSLRMPVLAGDEISVASPPIALRQKAARLIEVSAWVKTERVNQLQIDATNEKGERLDGFDLVNKALVSVGSDEWRLVRQVFRPRAPIDTVRILLCARGVNGYTLGGTADEPQNNAAGTVWWDDVRVTEPETASEELAARGVARAAAIAESSPALRVTALDLGEQSFGQNTLSATVANFGAAAGVRLELEIVSPSGRLQSATAPKQAVATGGLATFRLAYSLSEPTPAYREHHATLRLISAPSTVIASTDVELATWSAPAVLELGALYLRPERQAQLVRLNLGFSAATMKNVAKVRLDVVRRRDRSVVATQTMPADPVSIRQRRQRIPAALRGDFRNLLLADVDVSGLPIVPFDDAERKWLVRATILDRAGKSLLTVDSAPFCRLAHAAAQPAIGEVAIHNGVVRTNGQAWIPWGGIYGFAPHYDGPADAGAGQARNLQSLPVWNYYDAFGSSAYTRRDNDLSSSRDFPGYEPVTKPTILETLVERWKSDNLYTSTFFVVPAPGVFSFDGLAEKAGGQGKLDELLEFARTAPMIVSTSPGFEEAFGRFHAASPEQLESLAKVVERLRERTGKPVMVSDGGAWNRFEFEKAPYFDIYDPETEPLFPANVDVDLRPLVEGKDKAMWLRPQIYESVPFERWRFHTFVELMRGVRGWQIAHGPADASTMRGLHGELERLKPALESADPGPRVDIEPDIEHWSRRGGGKTFVIAATTHPLKLGGWRWTEDAKPPGVARARVSEGGIEYAAENRLEKIVNQTKAHWAAQAIEYLPNARRWPAGARLAQWVRLEASSMPAGLALLGKVDGRWRRAASWGKFDLESLRRDPLFGYWFLRRFHRNAVGFIGYEGKGLANSLTHLPERASPIGALPAAGEWARLEVPLADLDAADKPLEGVGFLHDGGRVLFGPTSVLVSDGSESVLVGDRLGLPADRLAKTKVSVEGLAKGKRVRVLFEDREIVAENGYFIDDFRGQDLYQRYGGIDGYGDDPVALHVYEIADAAPAR